MKDENNKKEEQSYIYICIGTLQESIHTAGEVFYAAAESPGRGKDLQCRTLVL